MEFRTEMAVIGPYQESQDLLDRVFDDDLVAHAAPCSYPSMNPLAWQADDPEHDLLAAHIRDELEWALNVANLRAVDNRSEFRRTHRHHIAINGAPTTLVVSIAALVDGWDNEAADELETLILASPAALLNGMGSLLLGTTPSRPSRMAPPSYNHRSVDLNDLRVTRTVPDQAF